MLEHYGVVPLPCRPYAPDLKGKVESAVGYAQETALKGKRFESIEEQNAHLDRWNERWAATRIHGTTKRQVRAMFEEEKPFLQPLPLTRFEYYRICQRTVHFDGYIEVDGAYYSAPPRYVGRRVRFTSAACGCGSSIRKRTSAFASTRSHCTKASAEPIDADRPKQTPVKVEQLAARIAAPAPAAEPLRSKLVEDRGAIALRALYGMLDLLRRYEAAAVDRACAFAAASGISSFKFLRTYLSHHATPLKLKTNTASSRRSRPTPRTSRR